MRPLYWGAGVWILILLSGCGTALEPAIATRSVLPTVTPMPAAALTEIALPPPTPTSSTPVIAAVVTPGSAMTATPTEARPEFESEAFAVLGDPAAPVTMIEFSDYGCPSCRMYELTTFPALREQYIDSGKVYYVYKDYPVVSQQGALAAEAAECAGEQGHYWEMHMQLFVDSQEWDTTEAEALATFERYAESINIDPAALRACVHKGRYEAEVRADYNEGFKIGISGTPTFVINNKLLLGAQPIEVFAEVLDRELKGQAMISE